MSSSVQQAVVDVFLALRHPGSGELLFGLRAPHLYAGGQYNLISGKVEPGEPAVVALIREAREEAGIALDPSDLHPLGAVHTAGSGGLARIGLVYSAVYDAGWHGQVVNAEPDKCGQLVWAPGSAPPQPLEPYNAAALTLVASPQLGIVTHGWPGSQHRMRLDARWFSLVRSGAKTVELRLAERRRTALHPGHLITFSVAGERGEHTSQIAWIKRFRNIADALEEIGSQAVGGPGATADEVRSAFERIYGVRADGEDVMAIGLAPSPIR